MKTLQRGSAIIEIIVVAAVVAVVAGGGYLVIKHHNQAKLATPQSSTATVPAAPAVNNKTDLNSAATTLDQTNVDAANSDTSQLDAQLNGL